MAADSFARGIDDLGTFPDRAKIEALGMLAEDALYMPTGTGGADPVAEMSTTLLSKLADAPPHKKVPVLYLLDYIVKKLGERFQTALAPYVKDTFTLVYEQMSPPDREKLQKLLKTWTDMHIFPRETPEILQQLLAISLPQAAVGPGAAYMMPAGAAMKRPRMAYPEPAGTAPAYPGSYGYAPRPVPGPGMGMAGPARPPAVRPMYGASAYAAPAVPAYGYGPRPVGPRHAGPPAAYPPHHAVPYGHSYTQPSDGAYDEYGNYVLHDGSGYYDPNGNFVSFAAPTSYEYAARAPEPAASWPAAAPAYGIATAVAPAARPPYAGPDDYGALPAYPAAAPAAASSKPLGRLQSLLNTMKAGGGTTASAGTSSRPVMPVYPPLQPDEVDPRLTDITKETLVQRDMRPVRALYDRQPAICRACALRFTTQSELQDHARFHSKQREAAKAKGIVSRVWDAPAATWENCKPRELPEDAEAAKAAHVYDPFAPITAPGFQDGDADSVALSSSDSESEHMVPAADANAVCAACGETFKRRWDDATERWVYLGAVAMDGELYHTACASSLSVGGRVHGQQVQE